MLTQIINGIIHTPSGWVKGGSVIIDGNKIVEISNNDLPVVGAKVIDAKGYYITPGGVEIHCHGGGGRDFMEGTEDAFRAAAQAHMQHGTTSIFPTLSSSTIPMIKAAAATTILNVDPGANADCTALLFNFLPSKISFQTLLSKTPTNTSGLKEG